jgi:O-antigen/teichoic acid export membrane protein
MGINIYASRVVLNTLGVEDYGIYNIVGGIVAMFGFLRSSMSGATSRFLTFELGRGDNERLKKTFSATLTVHFIIAGIILILGETIGLWWLENKLVVPVERLNAARWVYQFSIISSIITITQVSYNATIIAHEKMNVYAYVEILNSLLKLAILFIIIIWKFDKLILYAVLTLFVTIIITSIYKAYCTRKFPESHYRFSWNREIIKPMLNFSGWNMYGDLGFMAKMQGLNILLNLFFGVVVNAANAIATQVLSFSQTFSGNFLMAIKPQIVKFYAVNDIKQMRRLIINSSKFAFLLLFFIALPIIIETDYILKIWLKQVPDYATVFVRLFLVYSILETIFAPVKHSIYATGEIRKFSIMSGTIFLSVIPISYFFLKMGFPPITPYIINIVLLLPYCFASVKILSSIITDFSMSQFFLQIVKSCIPVILISLGFSLYFHFAFNEGWERLFFVILSTCLSIFISSYFFALDKRLRNKLISRILIRIHL